MALITLTLPKCDCCGSVTLPEDGPKRKNAREYDANERLKPVKKRQLFRCGKCKTTSWDKNFTGDLRKKRHQTQIADEPVVAASNPEVSPVVSVAAAPEKGRTRCKHRLYDCPNCHV